MENIKKASILLTTLLMMAVIFAANPLTALATDLPDLAIGTWAGTGANPGDGHRYIEMGSYNRQMLKWRVLDVYISDGTDGNIAGHKTALLLLDDLLRTNSGDVERMQFDSTNSGNWARPSDLKSFLNSAFYSNAFNAEEQAFIISANYKMGGSYEGNYGFPTTDSSKILLLSTDEANNPAYFAGNADRTSAYYWWLRSPGYNSYYLDRNAAYVNADGPVNGSGSYVYNYYGVRPAIKLDLTFVTAGGQILYQKSPRPATVELLDSTGNILLASTQTEEDGTYTLTFPAAPAGTTYTLKIKKPGYLVYTITDIPLTDGMDIGKVDISHLAGDINGDGVVNAEDLTILLAQFNKPPHEEDNADIDGNGIVNAVDLTYLLAGFNKKDVEVNFEEDDETSVIGVVSVIEPARIWIGSVVLDGETTPTAVYDPLQYTKVTVINTEGKEVTYSFTTDFQNGYNWLMNDEHDWAGIGDFWTGNVAGGAAPKWEKAIANLNSRADDFAGLSEGDIVKLVLRKDEKIKRIDHYIAYETGLDARVVVQSARERIIISHKPNQLKYDNAFTLPSDAIIFYLADSDRVDILNAASVLAGDFIADKVVAFDYCSNGDIKVLYLIDKTSHVRAGVFSRQGYSSALGYFYVVNGIPIATDDEIALINIPTLAAYYHYDDKVVVGCVIADPTGDTAYATVDTAIPGLARDTNGNFMAEAGIATYRSGTNGHILINSDRYYFKDDSYCYDLRDGENTEITNYSQFTGNWAVVVYDSNYEIVAAVITD